MAPRRVLLLMPATTYRAADFIEAGARLGIDVAVGTDRHQTLESAAPGGVFTLDVRDSVAALARIREFARQFPVAGIVGVEDDTTVLAAEASQALGLAHNPIEAVRAARDKHRARQLLRQAGLRVPPYWKVPVTEDPVRAAQRVDYPCVLKPLFLSASRGVIRADDARSFTAAFDRIARLLRDPEVRAKGGESVYSILVESYIPGEEVSVEALLTDGRLNLLALFDKPDLLVGPFFEETIYVTPSRHPLPVQEEILRTAERSAVALGLKEGPIHAELRVNERGAWPLEVAARSIGGLCSRTLRFGAGVSLEELILRHALGMDIADLRRDERASGVMMIPIPRKGRLERFAGIEAAQSVPGVEEVVQSIPRGQEVVPLPEGSRYLGFIFARGEDPGGVEQALRQAHRRLEIVVS